jgi:hypothetical protein
MLERMVCIDPGSETHGLVVMRLTGPGVGDNEVEYVNKTACWADVQREVQNLGVDLRAGRAAVACERVAPGQSGWTMTKTTEHVGRVIQLHHRETRNHVKALPLYLLTRREVLLALRVQAVGSKRDSMVRLALIELHGGDRASAIGTKHSKGPLYGVASHCWAALAVGVAARINRAEASALPLRNI